MQIKLINHVDNVMSASGSDILGYKYHAITPTTSSRSDELIMVIVLDLIRATLINEATIDRIPVTIRVLTKSSFMHGTVALQI